MEQRFLLLIGLWRSNVTIDSFYRRLLNLLQYRIGEGGYGIVYSARNVETRQWHAVKVMKKPESPEESEQDPIERETDIIRAVDHVSRFCCIWATYLRAQ